jgi:hypothetical protein
MTRLTIHTLILSLLLLVSAAASAPQPSASVASSLERLRTAAHSTIGWLVHDRTAFGPEAAKRLGRARADLDAVSASAKAPADATMAIGLFLIDAANALKGAASPPRSLTIVDAKRVFASVEALAHAAHQLVDAARLRGEESRIAWGVYARRLESYETARANELALSVSSADKSGHIASDRFTGSLRRALGELGGILVEVAEGLR